MGDSQRAASCMLCDVSMKHLRILDKWRTEGVAGLNSGLQEIDRKSSPKEMGKNFLLLFLTNAKFYTRTGLNGNRSYGLMKRKKYFQTCMYRGGQERGTSSVSTAICQTS